MDFGHWKGGRLGKSDKKGKIMMKIFFQIMLNEVLKSCKNLLIQKLM